MPHRHDPTGTHHLSHVPQHIAQNSVPAPTTQRYTSTLAHLRTSCRSALTYSHTRHSLTQPPASRANTLTHGTRHTVSTNLQRTLQHTYSHTTLPPCPSKTRVLWDLGGRDAEWTCVCVCVCESMCVLMPPPLGPSPGGGAERQPLLPGKLPRPPQRGH